jgi:8-oxo-dGTP pyrophosphatase MutT (NUDIX family)
MKQSEYMNRFTMIASSYLIFIKNGKIFLSRRYNTGYEDGKYSLPAGHIENGETLTEGGAREAHEEIGIQLKPQDLKLVHVMHRTYMDIRMDFFFEADSIDQKPVNKEPGKCDDLRWFPLTKLPSNTIPYIRHAIECYQKKIIYSEFGWGTKTGMKKQMSIVEELAGSLNSSIPYVDHKIARAIAARELGKRYKI